MKLFRVKFTTEYDMSLFGEIPGIVEAAGQRGIKLLFDSGGWNKGDHGICYHDWKSDNDPEEVENYFITHYGKSLVDLCWEEIPVPSDEIPTDEGRSGETEQ